MYNKIGVDSMEKDELLYMAKIAEQSERFDDMLIFMKKYLNFGPFELTTEEEGLFSNAFKYNVIPRRNALKNLAEIKQVEEKKGEQNIEMLTEAIHKIELDLTSICHDCVDLINKNMQMAIKAESKVFLLKMKGDYNRYLTEFALGEIFKNGCDQALTSYNQAMEVGKGLKPKNPLKLGLVTNFAVFYNEILRDPNKAFLIAHQAKEDAINNEEPPDPQKKDEYKENLDLLNDNIEIFNLEIKKKEDLEKKSDEGEGEAEREREKDKDKDKDKDEKHDQPNKNEKKND